MAKFTKAEIISRKARNIGSEDMATVAHELQWLECEGFRGVVLEKAQEMSMNLLKAVSFAQSGEHEEAGKFAGYCLHGIRNNRDYCRSKGYRSLWDIEVNCRDGEVRKMGEMVKWYMKLQYRVAGQVDRAAEGETSFVEVIDSEEGIEKVA